MFADLTIDLVQRALQRPLPGAEAQARMSTRPRTSASDFNHSEPPRQAAVLILLYPQAGQIWLPLTRRTEHVATHKGQISLPGGAREPGDVSLWETALREAREEIGLDSTRPVQYLGMLSRLYIAHSNFDIQPFVAFAPCRPVLQIDTTEVAELIELPLAALLDPTVKREETWFWRQRDMQVPFYAWGKHVIWGATAMMLSEFEALLARELANEEGTLFE
jgi:8-oxo-dGTP pyrophosphatase MutT (NUDIX family)